MPNIFKNFLKPPVNQYIFPSIDEVETEVPEEEPAPESPGAEDDVPAAEEPAQPEEEKEKEDSDAAAIRFAQIQADEIVADARRQGEALLEEYRRQAREELDRAREEAREEGYRQGYGEGLRKAQVEGESRLEEQCQEQARQVAAFLERAGAARDDMLETTREELRDLSIAIAEKVIHISLKSSQGVIARMIQVATEKLKRREWVHIYVGGRSAKELSQITPELMRSLSGLSEHIKIIPMPEDESGTCIIEMPDEIIDASASTQLQNIRELLQQG